MCEMPSDVPDAGLASLRPDLVEDGDGHRLAVTSLNAFLEVARVVTAQPEVRRTASATAPPVKATGS